MNRLRLLILISFLAVLALGTRLVGEGPSESLRFEAESGRVIANFWVVEDSSASGGRYARAARLQLSRDAVADMDFPLSIHQAGAYYVWSRVYWPNGCANSVIYSFLRDDEAFFTTFAGNDAVFERWHWVRTQAPARLEPGDYTLRLSIAEWYGVVDLIILSSDERFRPDAGTALDADRAPVNMDSRWIAVGGTRLESGEELVLSGPSNPMILYPDRTFGEGLYLSARLRAGDPTPELVRLLYDVADDERARAVELGAGRCRFVSRERGELLVLHEAPAAIDWGDGVSHSVALQRAYGRVLLWADGELVLAVPAPLEHPGKVGIGTSGGVLNIEDLNCDEREPIELASNFDVNISPLGVAHGWTPISGLWERSERREFPEAYMVWGTGTLLATAGSESWDDYLMSCALSISAGSEGGIVLRSLGENSRLEVTVRPRGPEGPASLKLTERTEAGVQILGEVGVELDAGEWCLLEAQAWGSEARVWLNGSEMLRCSVGATHGQAGLMALRDSPCSDRFPLRPLYFLEGGRMRQMEIPLKVTSAGTDIGVYFDRSPRGVRLVHIEYADPAHALLQALHMKGDSVAVLKSSVFDLPSFIACPVGDPPPQLPISFLIEGGEGGVRARVTSGPNEVALRDMRMGIDPTAEVGIYDRTPEPAARFDDVMITGLPRDVVRAGEDTLTFTFDTNYHDGRDLASWRLVQGVWTPSPRSTLNLVAGECLVGLVSGAPAIAELRQAIDSAGISVTTGVHLPPHPASKAALEITASGGQAVRLYLEPASQAGSGRSYRLQKDSSTVAEGSLQTGDQWTTLGLNIGPWGVTATVDGKQVASDPLVRGMGPFRVSLIVEGQTGARAHFDYVTVAQIRNPRT